MKSGRNWKQQQQSPSPPTNLEELVGYIAKSLVNDPSQVKVRQRNSSSATVIELRVAPEDMGRVIGREGRVANAIRALLRVADRHQQGEGSRKHIILEIM
jgi:predicted RNA-binding protein YlqC (UPF0109 family)